MIVKETNLDDLKLLKRGKVRDVYDLGDNLLIVSTDRVSAFDVILNEGLEGKGEVLTKLSVFWFKYLESVVDTHFITSDISKMPLDVRKFSSLLSGRSMLVRKVEIFPVECVVRGYLFGSAWEEYKESGAVCGIKLPAGLKEASKLDNPIFTPATKADVGHDENITIERFRKEAGEFADTLISKSVEIYKTAAEYALKRGIIIADTKFEWGLFRDKPILADEILTPDSSRFWALSEYKVGTSPNSYDKQIIRDYLLTTKWNKMPPPPNLPNHIVKKASERYREIVKILAS
jgi:phosphoribosylaminoimidazole-succinocarboxamide synthase